MYFLNHLGVLYLLVTLKFGQTTFLLLPLLLPLFYQYPLAAADGFCHHWSNWSLGGSRQPQQGGQGEERGQEEEGEQEEEVEQEFRENMESMEIRGSRE